MRYRTHVVAAAGTLLAAASVVPHASLTDVALAVAGTGPGAAPERDGALPGEPAWPDAPARAAAPAQGPPGAAGATAASPGEGTVSAARLLARTAQCDEVSDGRYRMDDSDDEPTVPVCATAGAVYWKADMDIDCDGKVTRRCNEDTDGSFQDMTAFTRSDGAPLDAAKLPYLVVPDPGDTWDYRSSGIRGGGLAAVVYRGRVEYAVVGDTGPAGLIGEASYATAQALGIPADPAGGGAPKDVTYIFFKDTKARPVESHAAAVSAGDRLARRFVASKK